MVDVKDCQTKLYMFKEKFSDEYGIKNIGIFGSVAREENTDQSDIDIVVDIDNPTLTRMFSLRNALSALFGCKVDVIRMRDSLPNMMKKNIERDVIYV